LVLKKYDSPNALSKLINENPNAVVEIEGPIGLGL